MTAPMLQSELLTATGVVRHGFFGRQGGVSTGALHSLNASYAAEDDPDNVDSNRQAIADALGGSPLAVLKQVHSSRVMTIDAGALPEAGSEADAMVTRRADVLLGILTADCAPLLFIDRHAGVVGAAHAGWKGAVGGIIDNTLSAMEALGAQRRRIYMALGPTISGVNYEVGPDFMAEVIAINPLAAAHFSRPGDGREHFDLPGFLHADASRAGMAAIDDVATCTYAHPQQYFSHRYATHQGSKTGRQIAVIGLT